MLKKIEKSIVTGLEYLPADPKEVKLGKNRTTIYNYTKVLKEADFGQLKNTIQLEINTFTNPVPYEQKSIQSYIGIYLTEGGFTEVVEKNQLQPFNLNVLSRERTFLEKMLSVIRLSYVGIEKLQEKIRHFYDLNMLYRQPDLGEELFTEKNFKILSSALLDDAATNIFKGDWMANPLASSPLLSNIEETWKQLETSYRKQFSEFILRGELPSSEEIISLLKKIKSFVEEYDKRIASKKK